MLTAHNIWFDGTCNICGSPVIETLASNIDKSLQSNAEFADYANMCLNKDCKEHKWHFVGDQELARYYTHK